MDLLHVNEVYFAVFLLFAATFLIQISYWWAVYGKLGFYRKRETNGNQEPVSIIILLNDELEKLKVQLPALLAQDYPQFEVVLVIQSTHDDLIEYLDQVQHDHSNVKVVEMIQQLNFFKGDKFALSIGIKSAAYDLLAFTDIGCQPVSDQWLNQIQSNFSRGKEILLGYYRVPALPKSPLSGLFRFGNLVTSMNYLSYALAGRPFMGVKRNMAFRKSLFYRSQGYTSHYRISDGEDDLFINQTATRQNVAIAVNYESQVVCPQVPVFSTWLRHRKKYFRTRRYYRRNDLFYLNLYSCSYLLLLASFFFLLVVQFFSYTVIALFIVRLFSQLYIFKKIMVQLAERKLLLLSPLNEVLLMILDGMIRISLVFDKKDKWKT